MERSFAEEVKQLALGEGQVLRGEGILAITKALLQAGVSVLSQANQLHQVALKLLQG